MSELIAKPRSLRASCRRLLRDTGGIALIEFAYVAPFMALLIGGGIELTNYSVAHMRVSQIAVSLADNASRAKQEVVSGVPRMREADVNESFAAAKLQGGSMNIEDNATLILSSLEVNEDGGQWIHWQRCYGDAGYTSSYGAEGAGKTGTGLKGMGPAGRQAQAEEGFAVMFAEVVYDYEPLMFGDIVQAGEIRKTAAMYVRDARDLSGIYNPSPEATVHSCDE